MTPARFVLLAHAEVPPGDDWLGEDERRRLAAMRFERRRADFRAGRWAAKRVLADLLGGSPGRYELRAAPDGAPEPFESGRPLPHVRLSLSHRAGRALCVAAAFAPAALGCDLERIEPRSRELVFDFFTGAERAFIESVAPASRDLAVALVWSAKESALKVLREGLRLDTRDVEVQPIAALVPDAEWHPLLVTQRETGRRFPGHFRREADLVLTVAAGAPLAPPRRSFGATA